MAPTVVSGEDDSGTTDADESTTTLKVIWHEPENMGPTINGYDVEYKKTTDDSYTLNWTHNTATTNRSPQITGLEADTSYQVRVRAKNGERQILLSPWSLTGVGSTNKAGNGAPSFDETGERDRGDPHEARG